MKTDNVFFIYSPVHWVFASAIIAEMKLDNILVFGPSFLKENFNSSQKLVPNVKLKYVETGELTSNKSLLRKLLSYFFILFSVPYGSRPTLWTSNINSKINTIFLLFLKIDEISILDEGAIEFVEARGHLGRLNKLAQNHYQITLWSFNPKNFPINKYPKVKLRSLYEWASSYFTNSILLSAISSDIKFTPNSVLVLTSPVSENGNSRYMGQEVEILEEVIKQNPRFNFILKMHYREIKNKYDLVVSQHQNVTLLNSHKHRNIPIQMLFGNIRMICGFHTSALFHIADHNRKKVVSLTRLVGSSHSKIALKTFPDYIETPGSLSSVKF